MEKIKTDVKIEEKASRLELLVRLVYWIPLAIILWVLSMIAGLFLVLQVIGILFLGKRDKTLTKWIWIAMDYRYKASVYLITVVDERPPILPENV